VLFAFNVLKTEELNCATSVYWGRIQCCGMLAALCMCVGDLYFWRFIAAFMASRDAYAVIGFSGES
jgi:hypothetical protein